MEKYLINDEFKNVKSKVDEYLEKNNIHQFLNINQGEYARDVDLELEDIQYDGNVKVVITDAKKEWRKVINVDNATRFIDALEFFKNPINLT